MKVTRGLPQGQISGCFHLSSHYLLTAPLSHWGHRGGCWSLSQQSLGRRREYTLTRSPDHDREREHSTQTETTEVDRETFLLSGEKWKNGTCSTTKMLKIRSLI